MGFVVALAALTLSLSGETWDGPKLKPTRRQEVYEFTRPPTFTKVGQDRYEIAFASKGYCDVAVAIHDAAGELVRHVVGGVLGANAPAPLQPDSLAQTVPWDGKDDAGRYVRAPETCQARVSLGLKPCFDRLLNWHPKDAVNGGQIAGLAADQDGVYVMETSCRPQLRMYDHDGRYLRTLWPFPADKFEANKPFIPTRTVEEAPNPEKRGSGPPEDGRTVPQLAGIGGLAPMVEAGRPNCLVAADGRIGIFTVGGYGSIRRLLRFRNDGTTGGEPIEGPIFMKGAVSGSTFGGPINAAVTHDGKHLYATTLCFKDGALRGDPHGEPQPYRWNAVYRFSWDQKEPVTAGESFIGEVANDKKAGAGNEPIQLNQPRGLATDAQNRLYVCDHFNNRVQVFSPDAKLVKSVAAEEPQIVAVHRTSGQIYVLCFGQQMKAGSPLKLVKFSALPEARVLLQADFPTPPVGYNNRVDFDPLMVLDSWTDRPRIWLVHKARTVRLYEERGDTFELIDDFEKDVEAEGLRPHMLGHYGLNKLAVDPVRHHLYYGMNRLKRCDPEKNAGLVPLKAPQSPDLNGWEDFAVGTNGLLYLRSLRFLARFDPDKTRVEGGELALPIGAEVPFDYGEPQDMAWGAGTLGGVIKIAALPGANSFDTGFGVGPYGDIVSFMKNYRTWDDMLWGRDKNKWVDAWGARNMAESREGYQPRNFPGRNYGGGELVMRWTDRGEPNGDDLVPALPFPSAGIKLDRHGNIYLGIGANMFMPDGKPHSAGCVAKFGPEGGKFYGRGDTAKLEQLPDRPPEFTAYGWGNLWTRGMFWAYPGYDQQHFLGGGPYPCLCASCRFDLDLYARSFVPKAYQYTVGVVDTNGNVICEIGRYGNPESPAMKPGDTDIGIAHCSYLATDSDRFLYLSDDGNSRIVRVKLGYHAEQRAALRPAGG